MCQQSKYYRRSEYPKKVQAIKPMLIHDQIEYILTNKSFNELETKFNAPDRKQF